MNLMVWLGVWHDSAQVGVLDVHVGIASVHHGCCGQAVSQLRSQSQLLEIRWARSLLLWARMFLRHVHVLVVFWFGRLVRVVLVVVEDVIGLVRLSMLLLVLVAAAGAIEGASVHSFCGGRWVVDVVRLVGLAVTFGAHGHLADELAPVDQSSSAGSKLNARCRVDDDAVWCKIHSTRPTERRVQANDPHELEKVSHCSAHCDLRRD